MSLVSLSSFERLFDRFAPVFLLVLGGVAAAATAVVGLA
jgi:hypothetical protein